MDPYASPATTERRIAQPGSPQKALIYAIAVDLGGTTLTSLLVLTGQAMHLIANHPPEQLESLLTDFHSKGPTKWMMTALGFAWSAVGGYVCASVVRQDELRWALVLAGIICGLGLLAGAASFSLLENAAMLVVSTVMILLGAGLRIPANRRRVGAARQASGGEKTTVS